MCATRVYRHHHRRVLRCVRPCGLRLHGRYHRPRRRGLGRNRRARQRPLGHQQVGHRAAGFGAQLARDDGLATDATPRRKCQPIAPGRWTDTGAADPRGRPPAQSDGPAGGGGGEALLQCLPICCWPLPRRGSGPHQGVLSEVPNAVRLRADTGRRQLAGRPIRGGGVLGPRRHGLDLSRPRPQRERPLGGAEGFAELR